jgi:[ribosomal protein S5]-alanine N-acetyltransferase
VDKRTWPTLHGRSCSLVVLTLADAEAWLAGEDEEQRRWFEIPGPATVTDVLDAIARWRMDWRTDGSTRHWGIWTGGQLAGGVELRRRPDERVGISYVVFPAFRRRGLAVEAIRLATRWAFDHLPIDGVVAVVDEANVASRATAERSGFTFDGVAEPWEYDETGPCVRYLLRPPDVDDADDEPEA